jgi:hypothetical protein
LGSHELRLAEASTRLQKRWNSRSMAFSEPASCRRQHRCRSERQCGAHVTCGSCKVGFVPVRSQTFSPWSVDRRRALQERCGQHRPTCACLGAQLAAAGTRVQARSSFSPPSWPVCLRLHPFLMWACICVAVAACTCQSVRRENSSFSLACQASWRGVLHSSLFSQLSKATHVQCW